MMTAELVLQVLFAAGAVWVAYQLYAQTPTILDTKRARVARAAVAVAALAASLPAINVINQYLDSLWRDIRADINREVDRKPWIESSFLGSCRILEHPESFVDELPWRRTRKAQKAASGFVFGLHGFLDDRYEQASGTFRASHEAYATDTAAQYYLASVAALVGGRPGGFQVRRNLDDALIKRIVEAREFANDLLNEGLEAAWVHTSLAVLHEQLCLVRARRPGALLNPGGAPPLAINRDDAKEVQDCVSAMDHAERALEENPRRFAARNTRAGILLHREERLHDAVREYRANADDHGCSIAQYNLGTALLVRRAPGDLEEAANQLSLAERQDPSFCPTSTQLGIVLRQLGRTMEAIEAYERAIACDGTDYAPHYNLGLAYHLDGQYTKAVEELEQAVARNGQHEPSVAQLAVAYFRAGRLDNAIDAAERAIKLEPTDIAPLFNVAQYYCLADRVDESIMTWHRYVRLPDKDAVARQFAIEMLDALESGLPDEVRCAEVLERVERRVTQGD